MITKIVIRSNGDAVLHEEDGKTELMPLLDWLVSSLTSSQRINGDTEIHTPLNSEPIKVKQWFDLKPVE
jgi:hypothetical protein